MDVPQMHVRMTATVKLDVSHCTEVNVGGSMCANLYARSAATLLQRTRELVPGATYCNGDHGHAEEQDRNAEKEDEELVEPSDEQNEFASVFRAAHQVCHCLDT